MANIKFQWNNSPQNIASQLNRNGQQWGRDFQTELTRRSKLISDQIQDDINKVKGGAVPFTQKAIRFRATNSKSSSTVYNNIIVQPNQAKYLKFILGSAEKAGSKIIPTSSAKLTAEGNIQGLRSRLKSGRYKTVSSGNRKYIIDTKSPKRKSRIERVIGIIASRKRKQLFDFYKQTSRYAQKEFNSMKGSFQFKWN
ncbi:hypothetical protein [Candidatus Symbiopectobacterium sp. NZEC135]|uniref:hypothetical protein n=1 Tax=Candidatus Symbiopectobacterium sp. NZEC135 TaxID=2820471 RepID=UPI0022276E79|nr:hypothetical protein [Candidatus Symbiopectobacterium sp. NZEC135]MCW2478109.1 hypothetical protein [Candidatus Symbiopectobacterium sp. NZEC135]